MNSEENPHSDRVHGNSRKDRLRYTTLQLYGKFTPEDKCNARKGSAYCIGYYSKCGKCTIPRLFWLFEWIFRKKIRDTRDKNRSIQCKRLNFVIYGPSGREWQGEGGREEKLPRLNASERHRKGAHKLHTYSSRFAGFFVARIDDLNKVWKQRENLLWRRGVRDNLGKKIFLKYFFFNIFGHKAAQCTERAVSAFVN